MTPGRTRGAEVERREHLERVAAAVARRMPVIVAAAAGATALGFVLEAGRHPDRFDLIVPSWVILIAACGAALALVRFDSIRPHATWVAAALGVLVSFLVAAHDALLDHGLASAALVQAGLVVFLFALLAWGWREQVLVSGAALLSTALVGTMASDVTHAGRATLVMGTVAMAAVLGAWLLDRQRYRDFVRTRLLERTSAEKEALLEAALDGILTVDDTGRIVEANAAAAAVFGYEHGGLVGRRFADLLDVGGGPGVLADRQVRLDALARREDGSTTSVEVTMAPIRRDGARTFACTVRDVSERKAVERQLHESKRLAEEEAEIASALLYAAETLSTHLSEPYMLDRVTCRAVEAVGCDWGATFVWDERADAFQLGGGFGVPSELHGEIAELAASPRVAAAARAPWPGVLVEVAAPGAQTLIPPAVLERWRVAALVCVPICRREQIVGALCLGHFGARAAFSSRQRRVAIGIAHATATALENARLIADLQAANRLKSEFVSTMSHELRTPLHVILGFAEMAYDVEVGPERRRECLARIQRAGGDLLAMIESTLEIGRLETGRDEVRRDEVSLPALLDELRDMCGAMPRGPATALLWCERVPPARLVTDQRKLSIVLRNLIGNALKFTPEGHVRLDVRVRPRHVDFVVSDTGIGIRPEDRGAIFEMFRQADQSDSRRFGGTGLGLYIVRRYVEQLGGTIDLESAVGAGSTFTVSLPRGAVPDTTERAA